MKICSLTFTFLFSTFAISFAAQKTNGDDDLLEWLDANSALVAIANDVGSVVDYVVDSGLFEDPYFESAMRYLSHPEYPLLHETRKQKLLELATEARPVLGRIEEVALVIHSLPDEGLATWSLMIKAKPETVAELTEILKKGSQLIEHADQPADEDNESVASESSTESPNLTDSLSRQGLEVCEFGDWFVVSNSHEAVDEIRSRRENVSQPTRSIAESRKFKLVTARFSKVKLSNCNLRAYGNPSKLHRLFPEITPERWKALKLDEMPGFGIQAFLINQKSDREQKTLPSVVIEVCVNLTVPRSGFPKLVESYKPLGKLPPIFAEPFYFSASAFDPFAKDAANKEIYELEHPDTTWEERMKAVFRRNKWDERDYFLDVVPRVDATYSLTFPNFDKNSNRTIIATITERILDKEASVRYTDKLIALVNRLRKNEQRIEPLANEFGNLYVVNAKADRPGFDVDGFEEQSYFLNDEWYITGAITGIERQLRAMYDDNPEAEMHTDEFVELIEDLRGRIPMIGDPFQVNYFRQGLFKYLGDIAQEKRATEKAEENGLSEFDFTPDDEGVILTIESTKDVVAVVESQFRRAIGNNFGNQIFLFAQSDSQLQIIGGLYPGKDAEK